MHRVCYCACACGQLESRRACACGRNGHAFACALIETRAWLPRRSRRSCVHTRADDVTFEKMRHVRLIPTHNLGGPRGNPKGAERLAVALLRLCCRHASEHGLRVAVGVAPARGLMCDSEARDQVMALKRACPWMGASGQGPWICSSPRARLASSHSLLVSGARRCRQAASRSCRRDVRARLCSLVCACVGARSGTPCDARPVCEA